MYDFRRMTPAERREILLQRRERGFPLHAPPHFRDLAGEYLITAGCYEHRHIFDTPEALSYLTAEVLNAFHTAGLPCDAWVFLPNHYHVLTWVPDLSIVSETLRIVHSRLATAMNVKQAQKGRKVWYRYSDRLIRNERHHSASVNYIHCNPVKHRYVRKSTDWPWVSLHHYLEAQGRKWLAEKWTAYPVKDYGQGWDD